MPMVDENVWKLSTATHALLDSALYALRDEAELLRELFQQEHPYPAGGYPSGSKEEEIDGWLEDLEAVVSEMDQLNYQAAITQ